MTKLEQAARLALEALEESGVLWKTKIAITALREALAEPAEQKTELEEDSVNLLFAVHDAWPYVHRHCTIDSIKKRIQALMVKHGDFADLHPRPSAKWVGLTDEEKDALYKQADAENWHDQPLLEAVEAKLKEKNT